MHKVSEGKLNLMIESTDLAIAEGQFGVVLCADDVADALAELLDRRAAEREQVASTEPRLAKWERRLAKMGGSLRYNAESGEWEVWWEPERGNVMDTVDFGDTPQAAVKAAWEAWKEAYGEH